MQNLSPWAQKQSMDRGLKRAIRHYRERGGLTQQDCADAVEMAQNRSWSDLEREKGRAKPLSLKELETVAQTIGTTTADLIRKARELEEDE